MSDRVIVRRADGSFYLREAQPGEAEALRSQGRGASIVSDDSISDRDFRELQREEQRGEEFGTAGQRALTAVEGAATGATAGLSRQVQRDLGLEFGAAQREQENPGTALAGNIGGAVAGALLSGGENLVGQGARLTAGGATAALGEAVASGLARRFTGGLGRTLAPIVGAAADGAASGALMSIENSVVNEDQITAETVMADMGLGAALGIGLGSAFTGGRYAIQRGGRGLSSLAGDYAERLSRNGLQDGAEQLGFVRRNIVRAAQLVGSGGENLAALANPRTARLAAEGQAVANRMVANTTTALDDFTRLGQEILPDAPRRLQLWQSLAEGVDGTNLQRALRGSEANTGVFQAMQAGVADLARTQVSRQAQSLLRNVDQVAARGLTAAEAAGSDVGRMLEALDSADNALASLRAGADRTGATARDLEQVTALIANHRRALQDLMSDPLLVGGRLSDSFNEFRRVTNDTQILEENILREFGKEGVGEGGQLVRRVDGERVNRLFRESVDERSTSRLNLIRSYIESARERNRMVSELFDISPELTRRTTEGFIQDLESELAQGMERFQALNTRIQAVSEERGLAGFGIVTGLSAPAIGGFVGAHYDQAELGVGIGLGAAILMKPASFFSLLGNISNTVHRGMGTRAAAIESVRRSLTGAGLTGAGGRLGRKLPNVVQRLQSPDTRRETYHAMVEDIRNMASNPQLLEDRVNASIGSMADTMPTLYTHQVQAVQRGLDYLANSLPPAESPGLFDYIRPLEPSLSEMDAFTRKVHALENPYSILDRAANFTLHPDEVEAVSVVYPELYAQIQQDVAGVLEELTDLPPYQARIQVGTLLQVPSDPSLDPSFLVTMQRRFAQTENQHQANFSARRSISVAEGAYSQSQQVQMRL